MDVQLHDASDQERLASLVRSERNATQRDRYRAVHLALQGMTAPEIVRRLDRSRRFVQQWVYRYRDGGLDNLGERPRPGQPPKLRRADEISFLARLGGGAGQAQRRAAAVRPNRPAPAGELKASGAPAAAAAAQSKPAKADPVQQFAEALKEKVGSLKRIK